MFVRRIFKDFEKDEIMCEKKNPSHFNFKGIDRHLNPDFNPHLLQFLDYYYSKYMYIQTVKKVYI